MVQKFGIISKSLFFISTAELRKDNRYKFVILLLKQKKTNVTNDCVWLCMLFMF